MGQFRHKNVVALYGVVTVGEPVRRCLVSKRFVYVSLLDTARSRIGRKRGFERLACWRQDNVIDDVYMTRMESLYRFFLDSLDYNQPDAESNLARRLLRSSSEIAAGMKYLSCKSFVHRVSERR